jgi:putative membrane protein
MKSLKSASPQEIQQETARLTRRMFTAPRPEVLLGPIVILSLGLGLLDAGFSWEAIRVGMLVFLLPALVAAVVSTPLARALGGRHYLRRSFLLVFVSLGMAGIVFIFWRLIGFFTGDGGLVVPALILVVSSTLWIRLITLYATSQPSMARSLPVASTQPVFGYMAIWGIYGLDSMNFGMSVMFFLIFSSAASLLIMSSNLPFKHAFGIDGIRMVSHFLDYMTEGGEKRATDIESFFKSFSIPIAAWVGIVAFRTERGIKALVVVPYVHPGPFAKLGGSDLPAKLLVDLKDLTPNLFVPHGPATHDFNPPTSQECRKIAAEVRHLLNDMEYSNESSMFVRSRRGLAHTCAQMFGDSLVIIGGMAPNPTDDIDHSTGYAASNEGKSAGAREALFIDAHNCMEEGSGLVLFGSQASQDIVESSGDSSREAMKSRTKGIRMGFAQEAGFVEERDGLGGMGIQALVIQNDGQTVAYLLYDGNNMIPGLRERLMATSRDFVDDAEVLTTDNHAVNATLGGYNPVGWKADQDLIVQKTRDALSEALGDLEDVEVGAKSGTIHGFKVFGHQSAVRLATVVSSTLSTLRINTFYSLLIAFALSSIVLLALKTLG